MKRKILAAVLALALTGAITGCSASPSNSTGSSAADTSKTESAAPSSDAALSGTVSTNGSTSMEKVVGSLAEAFMASNNGVTVTYDPTGSGTGITAVAEKRADIGLSSRALKDEEKATLTETVFALDGIAVIVNPENAIADLTLENITKIYTGEITNWKDIGGADSEIVLMGREAGSGTRDGFETITETKDKITYKQELTSTGAVIQAVASNPNAIGYASFADIADTVKVLTVGGVAPSKDTVLDGSYKIQRPFVLATRSGETLSPAAQAFFDYATSAAANEIIGNAGAVPLAK